MPFGLPPTAPKPQLSGVRPHLTPNSAVQKPQALANTARAFSPMLKTARQTLTQLPGPMQALGGLSLEGTGIEGVERLAMTGGGSKVPKVYKRTEEGKRQQKEKVKRRDAEVSKLRTELNLTYYKDPVKKTRWNLTELRQMASQRLAASSSSQRPAASSSSRSRQSPRPTEPLVIFGYQAALDAFDKHSERHR